MTRPLVELQASGDRINTWSTFKRNTIRGTQKNKCQILIPSIDDEVLLMTAVEKADVTYKVNYVNKRHY